MKGRALLLMCLLVVASVSHAQVKSEGAPYLGQRLPGKTPQIFAPGVISKGNIHSRLAISADGREMFWNTVDMKTFSTQILYIRNVGGRWTDPQPPSFAKGADTQSPLFSPDGKRLYFMVQTDKGWATRYVENAAGGWSAARSDGFLLNCSSSFSRSGRVYYSSAMKSKTWNTGIFTARYSPDGYSDAVPLNSVINVPNAIDYTPFVAPDESFLLFSSNRPLIGDKEDLYIHVSFRRADGAWSIPRRVSDIQGRFPSISPDGKYLFFCGDDGNIYWIDAGIINSLKPADPSPAAGR